MHEEPVPQDPGRDSGPQRVPSWPAWMDDPAYLASRAEDEDPGDLDLYEDPDTAPPPGLDDAQLEALLAEVREITAGQARAAGTAARAGRTAVLAAIEAVVTGRRGPGMPGSGQSFPSESVSPAAGFASGQPLDVAPGCAVLGSFLEAAAGDEDRYAGATDDEILGVIGAWDRVEANASARKHAAVAELIRRRPAADAVVEGEAQMPEGWHEFTARELGAVLGVSVGDAEAILGLARDLEVYLPGTKAAFYAGILNHEKAQVIDAATAVLDPAEARAAEAMVLDRAGSLTPGALRAAISRAVMKVAPGKAKRRREQMAKRTRVERWAEDSGNAGLAGRELPPAEVLAADQRVTAWAKQLRKAGLEGGMDALRARAYLDLLLGTDSRPPASRADSTPEPATPAPSSRPDSTSEPAPVPARPLNGMIPPGFAGRVTLTIPEATLTGRADRPGEMGGIGPIDPDLARELADAAARNSRSTWCVTVTDSQGHAIGHGCARPAPATTTNGAARARLAGPTRPASPGSPSALPISPGRLEDTAPGGFPPGSPGSGTCSSRSGRSGREPAITGMRSGVTTRG